jgi:hypothetical protein
MKKNQDLGQTAGGIVFALNRLTEISLEQIVEAHGAKKQDHTEI